MTDRLRSLLELVSTQFLDLDADGAVLVAADDTGSMQLYEIAPDGHRRRLTDLAQPVTGRYLPGARTAVVSRNDSGTERMQLFLLDLTDPAAEPAELVVDERYIHTLLDVRPDTVLYSTNRRNNVDFDIVSRQVSTGAETVLFDGGGSFDEVSVSPDGRWVAASRMTLLPASTEILLIETSTGAVQPITDAGEIGEWDSVHWLPDSSGLTAASDAGTDRRTIRRYDLAAATWTEVLADPEADLTCWPSPDGAHWLVSRRVDGTDTARLYPVVSGAPADERPVVVTVPDDGVLSFYTPVRWAPDSSSFGLTFTSPVQPPEAWVWTATSGLQRRTESNPPRSVHGLERSVSHAVPTPDGEQVPVYALIPPDADGSVVLYIHGGPESASVRTWNPIVAALAAAGHTVVVPNVRGSAGYGRRWLSMDDVGKRLDSVADLAAIHAWLPELGADPSRAALFGGSYGGYMVLAGLTFQPELWAAGVDIVGMSSLVTFLRNTSDYRRAYREREYGTLEHDLEVLEAASPLNRIDRLRAPLFVIHGANDPRVPLSEAEQVAAAVRANGADCEMLVYPDEGHGLAKRVNRLDAYPRAFEFLARHLAPATSRSTP